MATVQRPTAERPQERYVEFDEYIDFQLDKARNGIKWTDILAAAAGVAALLIGYLVLFVAADQWAFADGVPQTLRVTLLCVVAAVALGWLGWKVVWPYLRRVSDLYAARMLEAAEPDLRGSLFGLVDARRAGRPPAEEVRRALEKRAATTLADVDIDGAVDRRPLMRTAYVLLAVVLVACAYAVLSPKRVGPSLLRALIPTSSRGVATRTEILSVKPGDAAVLAGATLDVSVMIRGEAPERVMLYYSTADRRFADEPVELRLHDETTREYRAALVGDAGRGLSQDLTYRITANDDAAGPFAVTVEQPPVATVTKVELQYPPYTGLEPATRDLPPIDAIEGTNVALTAKANRKLKSAKLAFADDEKFVVRGEEVPMRVAADGVTLTATWKLAVRPDETAPTFYRIECRDADGKTNPHPAVYPIAIHKDQPPEVTLHDPKSDLERPANAVVPLLVTARDPDFRLRELTLRLEKNGQELSERVVLWEGSESEAAARLDWNLAPYGLKPGDVLSYYVQARDNREPEFNRRNTPKLNITITAPVTPEQVRQQLAEDHKQQEQELAEANARESAPDRPQQQGDAQELNPPQPKDEVAQPRDEENGARDEQRQDEGAAGDERNREEKSAPISNDGRQDDEVLRKLLERQRRQQQDQNQKEQDDQQNPQDGQADEQQQNGGDEQSQPNGRDDGQGKKSDGKPKEKNARQQKAGDRGQPSDDGQPQGRDGQGDTRGQNKQANDTRPGQPQQHGKNQSDQTRRQTGPGENAEPQPSDARDEQGGTKKNGAPGEKQEPRAGSESKEPGKGESEAKQGDAENGTRQTGEPSADPKSERNGEAGPNAKTEKGNPNDPSTKNEGSRDQEGGTETETRPPQKGDDPQTTRKGEGEAPQNAAKGERNGTQLRPKEDNPANEPKASDDERSDSDPGRPRDDDQPPGAAEQNPGKGRRDQRSQKPDSGESGTGEPNADGTPDGRRGPGDAGTQPGEQQQSDTPTGKQGNPQGGRPQQGNDAQQSGPNQPQNGQKNQQGTQSGQNQKSEQSQQGGKQTGQNGDQQAGQNNQQSDQQDLSSQPKGQSVDQQGKPGTQSDQQGKSGAQKGEDQAGKGQSPQGQEGKTQQGGEGEDGQKGEGGSKGGEGPMGEGKNGESPQAGDKGQDNKAGDKQGQNEGGQKGQGEQGGREGGKGKQQGGKGEGSRPGQGGKGSQPGQGAAQQGANPGQGGTQPGPRGGQGGGPAPANGGDARGPAEGDGHGGKEGGDAAGDADPANPEYAKKATDLVLKKLEDDLRRGEVDQELLKELGWTKEDMDRFAERLRKNLSDPAADETPQDAARRKEFEKMLESLSAETAPASRQARTDRVKDVRGVGTKNPGVPSEYRDAWESFTRSVAGRKASKPAGK